MNQPVNFQNLMNVPVTSVERPKPLPVGSYRVLITETTYGTSKKKGTPFFGIKGRILAPGPDVLQDQLAAVKGWQEREIEEEFYLTQGAMYRLREFLQDAVGLPVDQMTFEQAVPHVRGKEVMANMIQVPSTRPGSTDIFNEITGWAKAA